MWLELALGAIIGLLIGMTGIGGGVLVLPALTLLLRLEPTLAVGTASLYALISKSYAFVEHLRLKNIDFPIGIRFLVGAIPADIAVSILMTHMAQTPAFQTGLRVLIGILVILSGILLAIETFSKRTLHAAKPRSFTAVVLGVGVGALMGATSIGGGVLIIPLLIILFNLSSRKTVGTSIFIAVILVLMASIVYGVGSQIAYRTALTMAFGSLFGVFFGSRLALRMPDRLLKGVVTLIVFIAGVLIFL